MKKSMFALCIITGCLVFLTSCATPSAPAGYEKVTDREGDVDYISEPQHEGKDIVIKGYASPANRVTDDVRDEVQDWRDDIDSDEGLDK